VIPRRCLLIGAAALAAIFPRRARAAGQTLSLLVGAAAGSGADRGARAFAPFLERHLPRTAVEIHNLPDDSGLAAYRALAQADPSGRVVGWVATPALPARMVDRGGGALMQRLTLLGAVQREPIAIVSLAATPIGGGHDAIRRTSTTGEAAPLGTPPPGSPPHLAALRMQAIADTPLNIVAFPSAAAVRQAVLAGNVAAAMLGLGDVIAMLRDGRLVGICLNGGERAVTFPAMPALRDSGLRLTAAIRRGIAAPTGLMPETTERLHVALRNIIADPEFRAQADAGGFEADLTDGPNWSAEAEADRAGLALLWQKAPWLPTRNG
jgi:tripartite-type tricarboxylate transporter receptor subunit TctC